MSNRPQPALRLSLSRLAVAGAATLASVMTIAPAAVAADDPTSTTVDETTTSEAPAPAPAAEEAPAPPAEEPPAEPAAPEDSTPDSPAASDPAPAKAAPEPAPDEAAAAEPTADEPAADEAAADEVEADFGFQKFRVGVKIADGSYVPEGTSPVGSTFDIEYTAANGDYSYDSCTATEVEGDTVYCPAPGGILERAVAAAVSEEPGNPLGPNFVAEPGTTVRITQSSAPEGLARSSDAPVLEPCDNTDPLPCNTTDVVFENTGVLPDAVNDFVDTAPNEPVLIDVLANDTRGDDPATTVTIARQPTRGTAVVVTEDGRQQIRYTPPADYNGNVSFTYTVTNSNGSDTANIRIAVGDAPNYGTQKYRVGVQVADGSYVPAGVTTSGSEFKITTTDEDGNQTSFTCTTGGGSQPPANVSFCPGDYDAPAGATVTVEQVKAAPGLVASTETKTLLPCESGPTCTVAGTPFPLSTDLVFENTGLPPVARDDKASTDERESVRVDVLANDDSDDPATTIDVDTRPDHGTAKVVGRGEDLPSEGPSTRAVPSAGTLAIRYTPEPGFSGTDTFDYALTNSNGTTTATVTVDVAADGTVSAGDPVDSATGALPDAGGADVRLLGLAGVLLGAGGVLAGVGRRKRHGARVS